MHSLKESSTVTLGEDEPLVASQKRSSKLNAVLLIGGIALVAVVAVFGISYGIGRKHSNNPTLESTKALPAQSANGAGKGKISLLKTQENSVLENDIVLLPYDGTQQDTAREKSDGADPNKVADLQRSSILEWLQSQRISDFKLGRNTEALAINDRQRQDPEERMRLVRDITSRVPLIDGHNDFPMMIRFEVDNAISNIDLRSDLRTIIRGSQTDIPRLRQGLLGGQFWSIYVGCSSQYLDSPQYAVEQIDLVKNMVRKYSDVFQLATSKAEILDAHRNGKIASMMGVEGGHMIGESLAVLRQLYDLGSRYLTLTHQCNTPWSDYNEAEKDTRTPMHDGITAWGRLVVREMNRLGMLVDLAHVSHKVMSDVLDVTKAPVMFSHSSAYALCPHPRNVPDEILRRLKENRGIVMVNFNPPFINCTAENALDSEQRDATLSQVADHLDHLKSVVGPECVGIGSDFDGIPRGPIGLEDVSTYPALLSEMIRRGWSMEEMEGLVGANMLRVFDEVEKVRDESLEEAPIDTPIDYSAIPDTGCRGTPVN